MRAGKPSAAVLHGFLEHPETFLWAILIGNTLANFFIIGTVTVWLCQKFSGQRLVLLTALAAAVFLFYTLFDLLPKMLFRRFPNRLCLFWARPFRLVHIALRPLVALAEWLSNLILRWTDGDVFTGHLFGNREELRLVMQESAAAFTSEEQAMIGRVLDLQALTVRQAEIPMAQAVTVTMGTPLAEVFKLCAEKRLTRLPVWQEQDGQRRVAGVLDVDALIYRTDLDLTKRAGDFVKPALYLDDDLRLEVALQRMQRGGQRLAIVLGRDRNETGVLALEDILKVVFGEVKL
jgi:putative hemolysin